MTSWGQTTVQPEGATYDTVFVHLLNDFSGSPKVLRQTIQAASTRGRRAKLYVGSPGEGFLSDCGIPMISFRYERSRWRVGTLVSYTLSQCCLFWKLLRDRSIERDAIVYVNTLLPCGASLFGKFTARKVICHVHEVALSPRPLHSFLVQVARVSSTLNVFVSDAHKSALAITGPPARRVYNALDDDFLREAQVSEYEPRRGGRFTVLMVGSLRDYKGIPELLNLASDLTPHAGIRFELLVNDDQAGVDRYFSTRTIPSNLSVTTRTRDTPSFYRRASLVLNLSRVDQWVETFGMTILEAMAFGVPVVAPPVGGPPEILSDGVEGFLVDSRDRELLRRRVLQLYQDPALCFAMSKAGRARASQFSAAHFADQIGAAIESVASS